MVTYTEGKKFAFIDGLRFCRDDRTGYYRNSAKRKLLHRYVFEKHNGPIPKGYHVHHIDHDKENNKPDNLAIMTGSDHEKLHGAELTEEQREWRRNNIIKNAVPAAAEWHHSEDGAEWHKAHYESMKDALYVREKRKCKQCGKEYDGPINREYGFCSNACKSAWRRAAGLDDEQRICTVCGKPFTVNHYAKKQTCSRSCANRVRAKTLGYKTTPVERKEMVK